MAGDEIVVESSDIFQEKRTSAIGKHPGLPEPVIARKEITCCPFN